MQRTYQSAINQEMAQVRIAFAHDRLDDAFHHAERAHIIGQRYFITHFVTHVWMLRIGHRRGDRREIVGQILRLLAVVPGYLSGWVPKGNTGGADVSPVRPMPPPPDLALLLTDYSVRKDVITRVIFWAALAAAACLVILLARP